MVTRMAREWSVFMQQPVLSRHSRHSNSFVRHITLFRMCLLVGTLCCFCWGYILLVIRYGTISPAATALFTTTYDGRAANDVPPASPPWRPPFRVVVSLTTTPSRLNKVMDSVRSLTRQSLQPDRIYVNIPKGPMKRHPERSYEETEIPSDLANLAPLVYINRCVDDGPATKLLGALRLENNASTLIITVDDDFEYPLELVASLAWEALAKPDDVLGVCGWGMLPMWHKVGVVAAYVPYLMRPNGRYVDILQACCGNAYRRGFFTNVEAFAEIPPICVTVDDVWIAGYLRTVEQRHSAIISKRLDPWDPAWKKEEAQSSEGRMTLSSYNHEHQIHYKCIQAIEDKFQRRWVRNFEE